MLARPRAQEALPVEVDAAVDTSQLEVSGRATLRLTFRSDELRLAPYAIRVELRAKGRMLLRRDHLPPIATRDWKPKVPVTYELPLLFPLATEPADRVEVLLGFVASQRDEVRPPRTTARVRDGLALIAVFALPELDLVPDAAAVQATITAARELGKKDPVAAWDQLEFAFRRTDDYPLKAALQAALLEVGRMAPAELSFEETGIVARRIRDERVRYLRQIAGRLHDRGMLYGALLLLDEVGGSLQEDADRAVLGALADAERATADRDEIAEKVFTIDKAQEAVVAQLAAKHPTDRERLTVAQDLARDKKKRPIARALMRKVEYAQDLREEAAAARRELERAWLADVPPEERAEADAALNHACWKRTTQRQSHRFVFIGPEQLIAGIPADSMLRFDLAYLYLTDLFGRVPNPDGDRVTVYFKELWEFGGGIGGGKIIDIGNADPKAKGVRVDGGLHYHELTHCVDDTQPIYPGLREGLADFGAAFAYHELHQVAQARAAFGAAQRAFLGDYLERDLEYWRIPNYGPSAGFLLHFIQEYGRQGSGYAWQRYRKFFRDYRSRAVDDGRTPTLARAFAFHLVEAFGEEAFDDLIKFRWPLLPSDLDAIRREQKAVGRARLAGSFDDAPGSPIARDRMASKLKQEDAGVDDHALELGVVTDWWVIGPFKKDGVDADSFRFPPEYEIDFTKRYVGINNNPTWRRPGDKPVTVDASGFLEFHFAYMDYTATYALTHVTVEQATEAWFWLRCDDDATLFVDDALIGKYENIGNGLGPWRPDWRVRLPDAQRFAVQLQPGRHKVLLKIYNRTGPSGCSMAIATRNGMPLIGARTDAEPAAKILAAIETPDGDRWPAKWKLDASAAGAQRKLETTVGQWRVRNGALEGVATDRQVEWRKFTVRPGFPKDSPSNLAWLPEKATDGIDEFRLTIDLEEGGTAPKLCVIFQGDGLRDGLGGWTVILEPIGSEVQARLERYDRLVYQSARVPYAGDPKKPCVLRLLHFGRRLTVTLGDQVLFDQTPIRAIARMDRIGLASWGPTPRIVKLELRAPGKTR
jgi:hypothetical protein